MCALFALAFSSDVERVAARLEKPTAGGHGGALSHAMRRCRDLVWDLYRRLSLLAPLATSVFSCVWGSPDSLGHDSSPSHDPAIPSRCYTLLTTPAPPQACRSTPPYHAVRRHLSPGGPLLDLATETLTSQAHAFFLPSSRRPLPPPYPGIWTGVAASQVSLPQDVQEGTDYLLADHVSHVCMYVRR